MNYDKETKPKCPFEMFSECFGRCGNECNILSDTNFKNKLCPFYRNKKDCIIDETTGYVTLVNTIEPKPENNDKTKTKTKNKNNSKK